MEAKRGQEARPVTIPFNDGPIPRSKRCRGPPPVIMNPPISSLLTVPANNRVDRFVARVLGVGVGVGVGVVAACRSLD